MSDTKVDQIADRIYRISTYVPEIGPTGFTFNQFLVDAEEPLLYHTGMRQLFPLVSEAVARVMPVDRLRWIAFAHVEADECGAVNDFLEAAPHAQVAHGAMGVMLSLNDMLNRPPRALADGEVLDIGGAGLRRRVLEVATPHVPHNWESHVFFEQETGTLFCGDLATQLGDGPAVTDQDLLDAAIAAEETFWQTSMGPAIPAAYRRLADLAPKTLAVMHGSSYNGDCATLLRGLADVYETRFGCRPPDVPAQALPGHAAPVGAGATQ
ncbi:MAG: Anaerobic nitric oxide reductase flavorubredoxin [Frankiales bacterium]|nr:Anaerobic nitric oxide reductase flavorubredoxin [Frankiales bacterium]